MTKRSGTVVLALMVAAVAGCSRTSDPSPAASPAPVTLEMERSPTPPRTGANTVVIAVKEAGRAVTDATVTGELFMPVMESMGRTTVAFTHTGDGRYSGVGSLTMAGSWQMTVTVRRGNQTLAMRTFNLTTKE